MVPLISFPCVFLCVVTTREERGTVAESWRGWVRGVVSTRSGTTYCLEGPVDRRELEKLDIGELADPFQDGFPRTGSR